MISLVVAYSYDYLNLSRFVIIFRSFLYQNAKYSFSLLDIT